ncbi:unnamed protein product [Lactuca virosa]|uniref:Uncharacterized protein n=1 Tax=Lactuca virosa TaxID=75947 RepID=A0AAU9LH86_9ASTR|nr:unnamed protein product [Lactuca virosa]
MKDFRRRHQSRSRFNNSDFDILIPKSSFGFKCETKMLIVKLISDLDFVFQCRFINDVPITSDFDFRTECDVGVDPVPIPTNSDDGNGSKLK